MLDVFKEFQAEVEVESQGDHSCSSTPLVWKRSEQLDPDQFELCLEEVEAALAQADDARDQTSRVGASFW